MGEAPPAGTPASPASPPAPAKGSRTEPRSLLLQRQGAEHLGIKKAARGSQAVPVIAGSPELQVLMMPERVRLFSAIRARMPVPEPT